MVDQAPLTGDELLAVGRNPPNRGNRSFHMPTLLCGLLLGTPLLAAAGAALVMWLFLGEAGVDPVAAANGAPASFSGVYLVGGAFWDGIVSLVGALTGGVVGLVLGVVGSIVGARAMAERRES